MEVDHDGPVIRGGRHVRVAYDVGSTANLFSARGQDLVGVGVKSGVYAAFDRDSGKLAWKTQVSPGGIFGGLISAPAYADGLIFAASNDAAADQTIAAALDAGSGDLVWKHALDGQSFSGVAYAASEQASTF